MEAAPYQGIEVTHGSDPEVINHEQYYQKYYSYYPATGSGEALPPIKRICGLSRGVFWLAVAMIVLAIIIIGLGTGLGVALSKAQNAIAISNNSKLQCNRERQAYIGDVNSW